VVLVWKGDCVGGTRHDGLWLCGGTLVHCPLSIVRRNEIGDEEGKGETQVAGSTANGKG